MLNKKVMMLAILLVSLLAVSAVSATDNATSDVVNLKEVTYNETSVDEIADDVVSVENEENNINDVNDDLTSNSNNKVLTTNSYSYTQLSNLVNSYNEVYLQGNYSYTSSDTQFKQYITINRDVIIHGNGYTINGMNKVGIFDSQKHKIEFQDIIFKDGFGTAISTEACGITIKNCTFINNRAIYGEAGAIAIHSGSLTVINCTFIDNGARGAGVFSGYGYDSIFLNCTFINNSGTEYGCILGDAENCIFINNSGGAIYSGNAYNCIFINNSGGAVSGGACISCIFINNTASYGGAVRNGYYIKNCIFINNSASCDGGAVYASGTHKIQDENSVYINNFANNNGGAIYGEYGGIITNCSLINNEAIQSGGAIYLSYGLKTSEIVIANCSLINNEAIQSGGAIFLLNGGTIENSNFTNNKCGIMGGAVYNVTAINCNFNENTAYAGKTMYLGSAFDCVFENCDSPNDAVLGTFLKNCIFKKTVSDKIIIPPLDKISSGKIISIKLPVDATGNIILTINNKDYVFGINESNADIIIPKLSNGNYAYAITYSGNSIYSSYTKTGSLTINNILPTIIISSAINTVYNGGKYLTATLKDSTGKKLSGVKLTVVLGSTTYNPTTDKNGQVKIAVGSLVPKSYTAKISFAGNGNYKASSTTAKVTVKKATPKLTAKAKAFKKSLKTKKYSVTLKTNKNTVMKGVKLTLKVNGKTYSAKTNAKGQATFKITKLTKKGKYTAVVKFAGNKYYNAKTVKPKITIK